ncbi:MAG: efflux RND transporter periplasmic adaptor subunit [Candidatus Taylorbacteria bacterium]|nr:efflux RND transporter periplasmic adaptor subunit [Candidatus Taylorbacteria bacterium]
MYIRCNYSYQNMKSRFSSFMSVLKKKRVYMPLIVIIAIITFTSRGGNSDTVERITVQPETFVQEVSVTGKVVAAENVDMAFETAGRVAEIKVSIGDQVKKGDTLAVLSNGDAWGNVLQRQARVDEESARLQEVRRGPRAEDVNIARAEAEGALSSYKQATQVLVDEIKDAYAVSDDALRSKIDQLYTNPRTATPEIISFDNYSLKKTLEDQRIRAGEMLTQWERQTNSLSVDTYTASVLQDARKNLTQMRDFLNGLSSAVSGLQANGTLTQTIVDKYRNDISAARTAVGGAITSLTSAELTYKNAVTTRDTKAEQLQIKLSGATSEEILAQAAKLKSTQADLQSARAAYAKTIITAPFDGLITKVDVKLGQTVSTQDNAISMISSAGYEIESFVSESDIAKVSVGQPAKVTLDAYGKEVIFKATVGEVDPAETVQDGVSTYKTKLQFVENDPRIRSGMTANTTIQTAEKAGTVIVPQEALFLEGGEKVVTVEVDGKRVNKNVVTGGINAEGKIEIVSGLNIGDVVIVLKK